MNKQSELPSRKPTRLRNFDYSSSGVYFVTICTQDRKQILSEVIKTNPTVAKQTNDFTVGEGLAPPEYSTKLKPCGEVAAEQLKMLENRFPTVSIEDFVIMPDHIHAIVFLHTSTGGASPSPTLNDVICAFKSLTSRICKRRYGIEKTFQRSYAEHIVRNWEDYDTRKNYIYENPARWYYKNSER